ncbi:hypothetical protein Q5762_28485 [Streptomyces sp. P9(2023)]|uniref:hypothetical protein n=1 Tax=Streptomyces sp. P9(2023) TaxID=3064394 RepID=UPI0028F3FE26|nr:hypothetical protein [Streptomyces sp. P9(2023)]MDT9692199.1 hypothetical protein [Streptomyces sp. P9(2023)]
MSAHRGFLRANGRAYRRLPAALVLLLALGACGIRGTDVVEAGDAAAVPVFPPTALRMTLFFVGGDGRLLPVVRDGDGVPENGPVPTPTHPDGTPVTGAESRLDASEDDPGKPLKVLAALMAGPTDAERAAGLRTRLPGPESRANELFVSPDAVKLGEDGLPVFRVRSTGPVTDLDPLAVQQIVCTTAFSQHPAGLVSVILAGPDGSLPAQSCPATD